MVAKSLKFWVCALLVHATACVGSIAHAQDNNAPLSQAEKDEYLASTEDIIRSIIHPLAYEMKFEGSCNVLVYNKLLDSLYKIKFHEIDSEKITFSDNMGMVKLISDRDGTITEEIVGNFTELELETWGEEFLAKSFKDTSADEIKEFFKLAVGLYGDLCS